MALRLKSIPKEHPALTQGSNSKGVAEDPRVTQRILGEAEGGGFTTRLMSPTWFHRGHRAISLFHFVTRLSNRQLCL